MSETTMLSSSGRTEILVWMCAAVGVVVSATISLNVALPSFARDTNATQTQLTWVVGVYALVFAALVMPAGALADRLGRREVLAGGLALFSLSALARDRGARRREGRPDRPPAIGNLRVRNEFTTATRSRSTVTPWRGTRTSSHQHVAPSRSAGNTNAQTRSA